MGLEVPLLEHIVVQQWYSRIPVVCNNMTKAQYITARTTEDNFLKTLLRNNGLGLYSLKNDIRSKNTWDYIVQELPKTQQCLES
jgi:hypothetical protein